MRLTGTRICLVFLCTWLVTMIGCGGEPLDNSSNKPYNIVLISVDTLRADHLGAYGHDSIETPNMDRLAAEGVLFQKAYTPTPLTLPGHASMLTGTYPLYHGMRNNGTFKARESLITLAEVLKANQYITGAVIGAFVLDSVFGLDQGFDGYDDLIAHGTLDEVEGFYSERTAEDVSRRAFQFLNQAAAQKKGEEQPFFLWLHYFDPHNIYQPPEPYATRYKDDLYAGEVAYVDEQIGLLLKVLKAKGFDENTLIILTSDHGEGLMEHGETSHGILTYDTTLQVPLIIHNAELIREPRTIAAPVSLIDIMPTVMDILNIEDGAAQAQMQGKSLVPLMTERAQNLHDAIYFESLVPFFEFGWAGLQGLRKGEIKYISAPEPELYDTDRDPGELTNLHAQSGNRVSGLHEAMQSMVTRYSARPDRDSELTIDEEAQQKLNALGYGTGALHAAIEGDPFKGADPKHKIAVKAALDEAMQRFGQGHYLEAIKKVETLQKEEPKNLKILLVLGSLNMQMDRLKEAEAGFRAILQAQPGNEKGLVNLGTVLHLQKRVDEAGETFQKVLDHNPDHVDVLYNLATVYRDQGDMAKTEETLKRVIELNPAFAKAHFNLGSLLAGREEYEAALKHFQAALAIDPDWPEARQNAARCSMLLKQSKP